MQQKQNPLEELNNFWSGLTKSEKVAWLFNCVGFIASILTLVELARVSTTAPNQAPPKFFAPGLALGLWVIGFFTYIVFLHSYWQKNQRQERYDPAFRTFILLDLLYRFEQPILLAPLLLLVLGLYAIMAIGNSPATAVIFSILLIFALSFGLYIKFTVGDDLLPDRVEVSDDFKIAIESEWSAWDARVAIELARRPWVHPGNFADVAATRNLNPSEIRYILATYAVKHPDTTKFGNVMEQVYSFSQPELKVSGVLVNLSMLQSPYFII